ncbi:(2Fe-2S) ferredoxin domain-containing protein [Methylovulum psychrotolerans]|uniref:Ferredoxin n=2 Tax=Methylovulum psychrotolerans TaxID=1704499 RepID=A0A1Z4BZB4_9GAMM|nr:ferredoxin [Methylovulum psychrotolerans]ASF46615.1 ferredoxin [Methylovulum psychrotolerans]MBT9100337.1 ferredoxin [Methylovulum psychrotolerans]
MRSHHKHVLMCTGPRCTEGGLQAESLFQKLGKAIDSRPGLTVKRTRSHCFAVCKDGPIMVVYPEGVWYRCADEAVLERIVEEHLQNGQELSGHVIHRLGVGDV